MEPKDEPKKLIEKQNEEDKTIHNDETPINSTENSPKNIKSKSNNQYNKLELNQEHFQILQQKPPKQENDETKLNQKEIVNEHKALSDKDVINFKNNIEIKNTSPQIKEIKETYKKSRSQDNYQINYKYYNMNNDNNQNVYSLLNSYYKDIDLNFKDNKVKNPGKNFQLKNRFQESNSYTPNNNTNDNNINNSQNNSQYNYPFMPYYYYPNLYYMNNNNQNNNFSYNNDKSNSENVLSINNHINYHLSNNINYYNYNFNRNKFKQSNKYTNDNNEHKLYIINIENIIKGTENRTTVMIRHIPNRYSYQNLQDEINIVCKDKYDFLYLPIDSENNCNLGYAFINFINPLHIVQFYEMFKSRKWLYFNSFKECDLSFAKFQGKGALTSNFEKNGNKTIDKRKIPMLFEIKYPPKIDIPKKYFEMIKEYKADFLKEINWI